MSWAHKYRDWLDRDYKYTLLAQTKYIGPVATKYHLTVAHLSSSHHLQPHYPQSCAIDIFCIFWPAHSMLAATKKYHHQNIYKKMQCITWKTWLQNCRLVLLYFSIQPFFQRHNCNYTAAELSGHDKVARTSREVKLCFRQTSSTFTRPRLSRPTIQNASPQRQLLDFAFSEQVATSYSHHLLPINANPLLCFGEMRHFSWLFRKWSLANFG